MSIVLPIFDSHILSVLNYSGQLEGRHWLHELLHIVRGSFLDHGLANIADVGLPKVSILKITLLQHCSEDNTD